MKFPFYDAPNTATITCCHILENGEPILYVSHDEDDGMWQFLCGKAHETGFRLGAGAVFIPDISRRRKGRELSLIHI